MADATRCLDQLDTKSMSHFLDQVADSKDGDVSRHYAISLFSELARVHKQKLIPFIPRVMDSVLRSLSSTGSSSHQLQQACSNVVASMARYTIDPTKALEVNQDILCGICSPLLSALSSKAEPLASGAVVCLQALVESEKWKWAPSDLQETVCAKVMGVLTIEGNQTAVHMNLMRSLAKFNSTAVREYAGKLLKIGTDVLQSTMHTPLAWQQRVSAAQLIGTVLKIGDAQLAHVDLSLTIQILGNCQSDEVTGVRSAVANALEVAKHTKLKNGLHDKSGADYVLISSKPEDSDVSDCQSFKSNTSSIDTPQSSSLSTECSPCLPSVESARNASVESKTNFRISRRKENLPAIKPRRALSDLPFSSQPLLSQRIRDLRDFQGAQNSPCHNMIAVKTRPDENATLSGSKSLRGFFLPDAENAEKLLFSFKSQDSKNSSSVSGEAGSEGFMIAQERPTHRNDQEKGGREIDSSVDCSFSCGFALPSERTMRSGPVNGTTDGSRVKELCCKDTASSEEYNVGKIQSRYADMAKRMTDDPLCNGCMDLLSTPDTSLRGLYGDSTTPTFSKTMDSGVPLPNGTMFTSPRVLVQALQGTDCSSVVTSNGESSMDYEKDCSTGGTETARWSVGSSRTNGVREIGSQKKIGSDNSSCCTSEDGEEVGGGSPDVYRNQRRRWPRSNSGSSCKVPRPPTSSQTESPASSLVDQVQKPELRSRAAVPAPIGLQQLSDEKLSCNETQNRAVSSKTSASHLKRPSCGAVWIWALCMLIVGGILLRCLSELHDPHVLVPT